MKLTVFGAGYVGLVTAACFAQMGNQVTCVDVDKDKIRNLQKGLLPIYEQGLQSIVDENYQQARLFFTTEIENSIESAEIIFIAVGTPPKADGSANLEYVIQVAEAIGKYLNNYKVIVNKSTVPVGTGDMIESIINSCTDLDFTVISNPEFLKEGCAILDCMKPDRIIIGDNSERAISILKELYRPFSRNHEKLFIMDRRSAELTKYAANAMLATKISFINEMSQVAEHVGADIELVRQGVGADQRIGYDFIYPGCGYGGSCFPKDVKALIQMANEHQYETRILKAVEQVNAKQKRVLFDKIYDYYGGDLKDKLFAIWGVAFKPDTDDIREAPACVLVEQLWEQGAKVKIYDPEAMSNFKRKYPEKNEYQLCETQEEAVNKVDALVVLTEWSCFRTPNFDGLKSKLNEPTIFDGRNLYDPSYLKQQGFNYISIGRKLGSI